MAMNENAVVLGFMKGLLVAALCGGLFAEGLQAQTNPYAPQRAAKKEKQSYAAERDTIPQYGKGRTDFTASVVFPVQYFAQAEFSNPDAGYASQGFAVALARYLPFHRESAFGVHFSVAYIGMGATALASGIQSALDAFDGTEDDRWALNRNDRPRYHIVPFSVGLAYEGTGPRADVYARFMLHASFSDVNEFSMLGEQSGNSLLGVDRSFSSGLGLELGARFHNVLRVGLAWHYFGRPELGFVVERGNLPAQALAPLGTPRPISILSVNMGFSIDRSQKLRKEKQAN